MRKKFITLNSSDNLPSYPPDNYHSTDDVYWKGGTLPYLTLLAGWADTGRSSGPSAHPRSARKL